MRVIETRRQIENIFAVIFKHKRIIIIVKLKTENYFTVILCTSENHLRIPVAAHWNPLGASAISADCTL